MSKGLGCWWKMEEWLSGSSLQGSRVVWNSRGSSILGRIMVLDSKLIDVIRWLGEGGCDSNTWVWSNGFINKSSSWDSRFKYTSLEGLERLLLDAKSIDVDTKVSSNDGSKEAQYC